MVSIYVLKLVIVILLPERYQQSAVSYFQKRVHTVCSTQ